MSRRGHTAAAVFVPLALWVFVAAAAQAQLPDAGRVDADAELEPLFLQLVADGAVDGKVARVFRRPSGGLFVPLQHVLQWPLDADPAESCHWISGECLVLLEELPGIVYEIREVEQQLDVRIEPWARPRQVFDAGISAGPTPWPSATSWFLDYALTAERIDSGATVERLDGLLELGAVQGKWLASSRILASRDGLERLDTTWSLAQPDQLAGWKVGDAVAPGGSLAPPLRFAGAQWGTRFDLQPRYITYPLPSIEGTATLPSVVDLLIDGALRMRREVEEGGFEIREPPLVSGSGQLELRLRDLTGGERVIRRPFTVHSELLRPGLEQWSAQAGFLRQGFGSGSDGYGPAFASVDYRRGIDDHLTIDTHGALRKGHQVAAVAATWAPGRVGVFDFGVAASHGEVAGADAGGGLARLGFEHRRRGFSAAAELTLADRSFRWLGTTESPRRSLRLRLSVSPPGFGNLSLGYVTRERGDEPRTELLTVAYSRSLSRRLRLRVSGFELRGATSRREVSVGVSLPLGRRTSASARVRSDDGELRTRFELDRRPPAGPGFGARVVVEPGDDDRLEVAAGLATDTGRFDVRLARRQGSSGIQLRAEGSLVWLGGSVYATRPLSQGFGLVRLRHPGVRVYADNQLVGRTDHRGRILVPALRPFQLNAIRIDGRDLPLSVRVDGLELDAVPFERGALMLDFPVASTPSVLLELVRPGGSLVPAGARVERRSGEPPTVVGNGGMVYLDRLVADDDLVVRWAGGQCTARVDPLPESSDLDLGPVICKETP